jgi:hypothetical protein
VVAAAIASHKDIALLLGAGKLDEALALLRKSATLKRDVAARLGSDVHESASLGLALSEVPTEQQPYLANYYHALKDPVLSLTLVGQELQVWSNLGYAGSLDILARRPGLGNGIIDIKTGENIYLDHVLQLYAYAMADWVGADDVIDDALTAQLQQVSWLGILHVRPDGWEFWDVTPDDDLQQAFYSMLTLALWFTRRDMPSYVRLIQKGAA